MDGWWDAIDKEILDRLAASGPVDPADLAKTLGMSPSAVCSCLAMLAADGKVRFRAVEATSPARPLSRVA
jgi:DNA-binding Lrp family transcriptional regulator